MHGAPIASVAVGVVLVLGRLGARRQSWPSADYDGRAMTTMPDHRGRARRRTRSPSWLVDPSIEAAAGQSFGQGRPIALPHPGARA